MPNAIGVITSLPVEGPILAEVRDFGLKACQLSCWNLKAYTEDRVASCPAGTGADGWRH